MGEDTQKLDEVVVTALGIKRSEKALSYNVQKVNNDALTSVKDANFVNSLNGKVAGVNIQRSASGVGGSTRVTMRGNKSISGDNNVLYVVDGVPIGNQADRTGDGTGFGSGRTSGEGIANFNPDDIESVSVLTGPSAAALYGASAANGVILINTKKGEAGKMRIDVSSSVEFMTPLTMPKFQNRYGISGNYYSWGDKLENQSSYDPKDFFELGATFNNSFNLSTGNDKNQTYFSIAAVNSDGIVPNNKYHRYNVTLRNTAKFLNDKLTLDASASYIREYYNNMISYGTYFNPIVGAYLYPRGEDFEKEKYFERYNSFYLKRREQQIMVKLLKKLTWKDFILAAVAFVFIIVQVWLSLTMPDYMSEITKLVQTKGSKMNDILIAGGKMLACALGSLLAAVCTSICASKISSNFSANLRGQVFHKVQSFSMEEIGNFSTASLITRSTNDITQVQMLIVMGLEVLLKAPIMAVWALCKISTKNWQWTASTGVAVVVLLSFVCVCVAVALPKFKKLQSLTDNLNRVTRENLTGLNVVRAYNAEGYQQKKFNDANDELTKTQLFANRTMGTMMPGIQMVMNGLMLAIYWIGAYLISNAQMFDKLTIFSDMIVFTQYAMQVVMSFMMLVMIFVLLPRASVSAKRINEVLDMPLSIKDGTKENGIDGKKGEVEFRNVSFCYPDAEKDVIEDISFTAHKGETIAFIGSTGCGKSTVINMIPRFYDATKGEVLVDGVNVKEYTQKALRNKIGYVSQKAVLFTGSIKSNVAYGDNGTKGFTDDDVKQAIETAQAKEFVDKTEGGVDAFVAQGGSNFSGGQKQRLSIARAICRHPEILIFDDSFSALDYKTDRVLRDTLRKTCADATRFIVAQRIGTIRDADKIIVLDDGKIAGMGKHNELMETCEVYRQIAYSQLSKEELA